MNDDPNLNPIMALNVEEQKGTSVYPEPFRHIIEGRSKRKLGDHFGLTNYGVNYTTLNPGSASALQHYHSKQDELVYILMGNPTLLLGNEKIILEPGMCYGFKAGVKKAHQLINETEEIVEYIEIGDRTNGDEVEYPNDDIKTKMVDGKWEITKKDGSPF